jgi:hypothetical protein
MSNRWRLALMFDAPLGGFSSLESGLKRSIASIVGIAGDGHVRLGVADTHSDLKFLRENDGKKMRTVDAAVEVSVPSSRIAELSRIAGSLRSSIEDLADLSSLEIMAGPVFPIVPVREGGVFLSLAFKRYPGTTSKQFRDWWLHQHSKIATPVLGEGLLAYDQVHLDHNTSEQVAHQLGVPPVAYDAYDNLTWADRDAFLRSISDVAELARVNDDEVGRIDDPSRRSALMQRIY